MPMPSPSLDVGLDDVGVERRHDDVGHDADALAKAWSIARAAGEARDRR